MLVIGEVPIGIMVFPTTERIDALSFSHITCMALCYHIVIINRLYNCLLSACYCGIVTVVKVELVYRLIIYMANVELLYRLLVIYMANSTYDLAERLAVSRHFIDYFVINTLTSCTNDFVN